MDDYDGDKDAKSYLEEEEANGGRRGGGQPKWWWRDRHSFFSF